MTENTDSTLRDLAVKLVRDTDARAKDAAKIAEASLRDAYELGQLSDSTADVAREAVPGSLADPLKRAGLLVAVTVHVDKATVDAHGVDALLTAARRAAQNATADGFHPERGATIGFRPDGDHIDVVLEVAQ